MSDARLLDRIAAALREETDGLLHPGFDIEASAARKVRLLHDLRRAAVEGIAPAGVAPQTPELATAARSLARALADNRRVLDAHLAVSKAVSGLVTGAVRREIGDGTYAPTAGASPAADASPSPRSTDDNRSAAIRVQFLQLDARCRPNRDRRRVAFATSIIGASM